MATTDPAEPDVPDVPVDPVDAVDTTDPAHLHDSVNAGDSVDPVGPVDTDDPIKAALSPAKLGLESNEGVVALLKEINESLRDLKEHSARFIKLVNLSEAEEEYQSRQDGKDRLRDSSRGRWARHSRHESWRVESTSYYSYSDSDSRSEGVVEETVGERDPAQRRKDVRRTVPRSSEVGTTIVEERIIPPSRRDNLRTKRHPSVERRPHADRRDRRRSRASSDAMVSEERSAGSTSQSSLRVRRGKEVTRNVARLSASGRSAESSEPMDESSDDQEDSFKKVVRLAQRSMKPKEPSRRLLKGYNMTREEYGDFPHPHLCEQLFGGIRDLPKKDTDDRYSWLEKKGIIFAHDERCGFTFDLAHLMYNKSIAGVQSEVERVERFAHELRERGGFFFFRESYVSDKEYGNKVYNGKYVIRCKDNAEHALPRLSGEGDTFSEEFLEARSDFLNPYHFYKRSEPTITYHYKGEPTTDYTKGPPTRVVSNNGYGPDTIHTKGREVFQDPHIIARWRRLCVLTGLSGVAKLDQPLGWLSVPIFAHQSKIDRGKDDGIPSRPNILNNAEDHNDDDDYRDIYKSISEHLNHEQMSTRQSSRRRVVKFQFSWYEMVPRGESKDQKFSGRLYQDKDKRTIQLQSFMAIGFWQRVDEDRSGDCNLWTLIILAPAFFYHNDTIDPDGRIASKGHKTATKRHRTASKELNDLIGQLENILPTISATLLMIIPRIVAHWTEVSNYVEHFIASQDSFLHEKRHDRLLFDDDSFTRSRQYFWVITSTGEFIIIVEKTINEYKNIAKWVSKDSDTDGKLREVRVKLEAVRDRFERQRERATELREGLFSASAVVESRLSTRLGQNVKLLTYVSIFYLPLAFCAALWAVPNITEKATRIPFIVATFLVGLGTYFIVFNLDALVALSWKYYSEFRTEAIKGMTYQSKNSPRDDKWQKRAKAFNRFEPDRGETRPSEWYIMWYALLCLFRRSIMVEDTKREDEHDEDGLTESDSETSSEEDFEEASESLAESSRKMAWISWVRERFRKSEANSASASNEESSQNKSWVSWLRELFMKAKNDREKRGPSTV